MDNTVTDYLARLLCRMDGHANPELPVIWDHMVREIQTPFGLARHVATPGEPLWYGYVSKANKMIDEGQPLIVKAA